MAKSMAAIKAEAARIGTLEYRTDKDDGFYAQGGPAHRVACVRCSFCNATTEVHQSKNASGEWGPDPAPMLSTFGWIARDDVWFCGKTCIHAFATKMNEGHSLEVVPRANYGPGLGKDLYATKAPAPIVAQATTPAMPIVNSGKRHR
jgi:hypothetical protein